MVSSLAGIMMSNSGLPTNNTSRIMTNSLAQQRTDFGQLISNITHTAMGSLQDAEALSLAKMEGVDVDVRKVVNSLLEAEQNLNVTLAIRDKIVQGYLEISHIQI